MNKDFKYSIRQFVLSKNSRYIYFNVYESIYHPIYRLDLKKMRFKKLYHNIFSSDLNLSPYGNYIVFFNQTARYPNEVFKLNLRAKKL